MISLEPGRFAASRNTAIMLLSLRIQDLAIIDRLDLEFSPGLTIMTGETGAGKSIILGALGLILGDRSTTDDIRSGCDRARVEAVFDLGGLAKVRAWLADRGLESDDEDLLLTREIARSGRSRCFVMGSQVPVSTLRELSDLLVDLHGQHQHQSLLEAESHLEALDGYGRTEGPRGEVAALCGQWQEFGRRLADLSRDEREIERRKDMLAFQVGEIEAARLEPGEDVQLSKDRDRLAHAEALAESAANACDLLAEGERAELTVLSLLSQIEDALQSIAKFDASQSPLLDEVREERFRLEDAAARLSEYRSTLDPDPARLEQVEDRLDVIRQLKRKYGETIEDILDLCESNRRELETLENRDTEIEKTRAEWQQAAELLGEACGRLSEARRAAAAKLDKALVRFLADLNMPHTRFSVAFEREPASPDEGVPIDGGHWRVDETGADRVEFMISPNPGEELKPLRRIASGGEISRIMLALKSLVAKTDKIPTLVFDEIDVGIGGATAERVGEKMAALSQTHQIVCITHLPQIAARAQTHFAVDKKIVRKRAVTTVRRLGADERAAELARMLEGAEVTDLGRRHAAQMIEQAGAEKRAARKK